MKKAPTWQEQYDLGVRYLSEGNYKEAILAFTKVIQIEPANVKAYLGLSEAYYQQGDLEAAKDILRTGLLAVEDGLELEERSRKLEPAPEPKQVESPADALAQIVNTTQRRYPVIYLNGLEDARDQVLELTSVVEADPFAQLAACYDFLVAQMNSGSRPSIDYTMSDEDIFFFSDMDDYESQQAEYFCAVGFSDWEGDYVVYARMFYTMAKHIGFDARMIRGNTPATGGGQSMHKWVEIDFGGQTYVFDAYLGANFARRGLIADPCVFFATTYDAHPGAVFGPGGLSLFPCL